MIDLYTAATSNGQRAAIILEECGLPYRVRKVDLAKGEQREPEFLRLNPRGQVPVVVDDEGPGGQRLVLAQSVAILLHYAMQTGRFLPEEPAARAQVLQYLCQCVTDIAPASATLFATENFVPEKVQSTTDFFMNRLMTHFRFIDQRLGKVEFLAGSALSVADFALYPVYATRKVLLDGQEELPNLSRWGAALAERPTIQRAMATPG